MQTRTESIAPSPDWLNPFGSWEAAARWNAMAFEWITNGWKQWLELSTAWPALERAEAATAGAAATAARAGSGLRAAADETVRSVVRGSSVIPAQAGTQEARNARSVAARDGAKPRASSAKTERAAAGRREGRATATAGAKRAAGKRSARAAASPPRSRTRTRG